MHLEVGNVLPHCVVRIAGLSFSELDGLVAPEAHDAALDALRTRRDLRERATALSADLFDLVPTVTRSSRRRLLRLRRDVFNIRPVRPEDLEAIQDVGLQDRLAEYQSAVEACTDLEKHYRAGFACQAEETRRHLRSLVANPDFGAGLQLSSPTLASALLSTLEHPERSLDRKTEQGLLRYLTRMVGKATPFGRFCAIAVGRLGPALDPLSISGDPNEKWSRVRSNKGLMRAIIDHLLEEEEARCQLPLRLNPTLSSHENDLRFLAAFDVREAFQTVERNPALDLVISRLDRMAGGAGTIQMLAAEVASLPKVQATELEARRYLDRLLNIGLLQLDLPGLGHDPEWPDRLVEVVERIEGSAAADDALGFLTQMASGVAAVREQGVTVGPGPLQDLGDLVASTLAQWSGRSREARRPPVYEDAALDGEVRIDSEHFGAALSALHELTAAIAPVGFDGHELGYMRECLDGRFGGARVGLLTFYETYYREHVRPREDARRKREGPDAPAPTRPHQPPEENTPEAIRSAFFRLVARRWAEAPEAREIRISRDDVAAIGRGDCSPHGDPHSLSVFVNWVPRPGDPVGGQIVLPSLSCLPGFGKYFSRFLYLLPEDVLEAVTRRSASGDDLVLAEIAGDQAFNANLRPPTQPSEIVYPTGDRIGCPEAIEVSDLEIGPIDDERRVGLFVRGTDRRVLPLDLGFLNPRMRPPLYQLLRRFSPSASTRLPLPTGIRTVVEQEGASATDLMHRPRITYRGLVVIGREAWALPGESVPLPETGESEADFFMRVQAWRLDCGLPERVYLKIVPRPEPALGPPSIAHGRPPLADLRKPQYLDFRSPLLVGLLARYRDRGRPFVAVFEECLPAASDLPQSPAGEPFVTETILQMELGPDAGMAGSPAGPWMEAAHAGA